jgi:hypothetical protein
MYILRSYTVVAISLHAIEQLPSHGAYVLFSRFVMRLQAIFSSFHPARPHVILLDPLLIHRPALGALAH